MTSSSDSPIPSNIDSESVPSLPSAASPSEHQEEGREKMSPFFKEFVEKLEALPTPEEKIASGLAFMQGSISQEGSPRFREFWEARRIVLPFFKDNLNPAIRSKLWGDYVELTVEARRLKEILEEQSLFAMEQIDLAIKAIEGDMGNFQELLAQAADIPFGQIAETLKGKLGVYQKIQSELNILNVLASKLNGLRKEIIKTDMRIRFKTKFFKRLSDVGDQIFPKRKELIEAVSSEFEKDVDQFISDYFKGDQASGAPYYALREEIKTLQGMAKHFTLNSSVFTRTRLKLSECWDKVKLLEREHKKEVFERKQASSEQKQSILALIEELKVKAPALNLRELDLEIDQIFKEMRAVSLHRDDVRFLQGELHQLREPLLSAQEQKARELEAAEREKLRLKKEKILLLKEQIAQLLKEGEKMELDVLTNAFSEIQTQIEQLEASKMEKQQIERTLRPLKDFIADKKEHSLLNLSEDDKKSLENLLLVLQQKKERRQEVKNQLEIYRKAVGASNLDFEKAMQYRELMDQEKERLEKANSAIVEIEQKIAELES